MTFHRFVNGNIVTPAGVLPEATIDVEAGLIVGLAAVGGKGAQIDLAGGWIMPGFIDTQVNGGGGALFNDAPTVETIATIGAAHARYGTTGFLPTLISDDAATIAAALDATDAAIDARIPGVVGVHIEGPIINVARKGIHDPDKFRRLDPAMMALLTAPRRGRVMLTLAPELVSLDEIRTLVAAGVIVSVGHSDADYATMAAAFGAGVTGVTHLFNAMSPLLHRAPGVVGAALENEKAYCGLIVDGYHVHDAALRIALRARPHDRFLLVTDAMPCVGAAEKDFVLQGRQIRVENGRCIGEDGTLAGSDLDMAGAVRNMIERVGATPAEAAAMAATNPAAFLHLDHERGALARGRRADWVRLTKEFQPAGTWIGGEQIA